MVKKCPQGECKEIDILEEAVFGQHQDGLTYQIQQKQDKSCMNKYIKKPHMSVVVSLLIWVLTVSISSVGTGYKLYFGQESAPLLYAKKELCNNNQSEIKLLKQSYETLNKNIDKLGERIQEREKKVDEQFRDQNQKMEKSFDEIKSFMKTILRHTNSDRNNQ